MSGQILQTGSAISGIDAGLDSPAPGQKIYDRAIFLSGWVHAPGRPAASCEVSAYLDDSCVAETRSLSYRPDICANFGLTDRVRTGFRMLGKTSSAATEPLEATLRITASWDGESRRTLVEQPVLIEPTLLSQRHYGEVVYPENETLLHRNNIYGSGPPLREPGVEAMNLILGYLPEGASVVDIGCGAGAYGPGLIAAGHPWMGFESSPYCCEILQERQLPHRSVDLASGRLPAGDREWDCGICIEVLEHVQELEAFLSEIARITRQRVLFSVPNIEVLPYTYGWGVVPWHLLEADHKNFFTRGSLRALLQKYFRRVEIACFGEHPLRMREGLPIYVHLFAVADK